MKSRTEAGLQIFIWFVFMCDTYFLLFWGNLAAIYKIGLPRGMILVEHLSTDVKLNGRQGGRQRQKYKRKPEQ